MGHRLTQSYHPRAVPFLGVIKCLCIVAALFVNTLPHSASAAQGTIFSDVPFQHGGFTRTYDYYIPNDLPGSSVAVVFILHGGGAEAADMFGTSGFKAPWSVFLELADADKFIVVAPDGAPGSDGNQYWN
ncbi:MAG: hypothetical protein ACREA0_32475, partial [bacterium]